MRILRKKQILERIYELKCNYFEEHGHFSDIDYLEISKEEATELWETQRKFNAGESFDPTLEIFLHHLKTGIGKFIYYDMELKLKDTV